MIAPQGSSLEFEELTHDASAMLHDAVPNSGFLGILVDFCHSAAPRIARQDAPVQ